ncbi:MAG: endonuclease, partial [Acidobacteriota bacterium]
GGYVRLELSRDGGSTWSTITSATANDGSHNWTVTGPASATCRIRVTSTTVPAATDTSNASFTIL